MRYFLFLILINVVYLRANPADTNTSYLDVIHSILSDKVNKYSNTLDQRVSTLFTKKQNTLSDSSKTVDTFLKNKKYINETDKSFVSVNFTTQLQSKGQNKNKIDVNAHIALKETNKKFNLFLSGINHANTKIISRNTQTELGLNYFRSDYYKIQSKFSIGIRGFHPFIGAQCYRVFLRKNWKIEPIQIFEYSAKEYFKESTFVYFDKTVTKNSLLRFFLHRGTQSKLNGMNYDISSQYFWTFSNKSILSLAEVFAGNTKYRVTPSTQIYNGINNYTTLLNFRKNIWKKWFFYQISPSVNFHKKNNYKANYAITFLINLYFGDFL